MIFLVMITHLLYYNETQRKSSTAKKNHQSELQKTHTKKNVARHRGKTEG